MGGVGGGVGGGVCGCLGWCGVVLWVGGRGVSRVGWVWGVCRVVCGVSRLDLSGWVRRWVVVCGGCVRAVVLMNLFQIPGWEGGHLLCCAYEAITGRTSSDSVLQFLMSFGLVLVLGLTLFAVVMNLICP